MLGPERLMALELRLRVLGARPSWLLLLNLRLCPAGASVAWERGQMLV